MSERGKERFTLEKERIAQGGSFVKSDGNDLLKVALLKRARRANRSHRSLKKSNRSNLLLGIKRGKASDKHMRNTNFSSESLVL